ncbi:MAG: histidinol phosphate phosphatase [Armatimonadetes bacterium]|nr:histidinol phosphate phosphatase [Armatimonadota bacterium]
MSPRLHHAIQAALSAGRSTLAHYQTGVGLELKGDLSPVTIADKNAEESIRQYLGGHFPGETILGEEQGLTGASDDRWVVDPIDGTKSFVTGVPLYATLLAYEQAGQPILGVCYFPALNELFYAEQGGGAFWNGRPIQATTETDLRKLIIAHAGLNGLLKYNRLRGLEHLSSLTMGTRTWCDAYGHMLVASGRAAAMIDPVVSRWDVSALLPILSEAGAVASTFAGRSPLEPAHANGSLELISAAPLHHRTMLEAFGEDPS